MCSSANSISDLELIGYRYSIITLVFFITYVILQPFATVVLRKVGPRLFLPSITVLWGIVMMLFGFLTTWTQMVSLIWLLTASTLLCGLLADGNLNRLVFV